VVAKDLFLWSLSSRRIVTVSVCLNCTSRNFLSFLVTYLVCAVLAFEGCGSYATKTVTCTVTSTQHFDILSCICSTAVTVTSTAPGTVVCASPTPTSRCPIVVLPRNRHVTVLSPWSTCPTATSAVGVAVYLRSLVVQLQGLAFTHLRMVSCRCL